MRILVALMLILFCTQAHAYRVDNTIINDAGGERATVTSGRLDVNANIGSSNNSVKIFDGTDTASVTNNSLDVNLP